MAEGKQREKRGEVESSMMRNGRRKEEGEKGGQGADTNTELIPSELQPVGRRIKLKFYLYK